MVAFREFERSAVRLKNDVLSAELVPDGDGEIPGLIYDNWAKGKTQS